MITNTHGNLTFDKDNQACQISLHSTQGKTYAFLTCIEATPEAVKNDQWSHTRDYWGEYLAHEEEESIRQILNYGSPWPKL